MNDHAPLTRRTLVTIGGASAGAVLLAACTPGGGQSANGAGTGDSGGSSSGGGGTAEVSLASIPVGGAVSATLAGKPIVVSQPSAGQVVAFSAVCTHQGCTVAPQGKEFDCPCHGSKFDATTGDVLNGPARDPLPKLKATVSGDSVTVSA
ncbi:ubiquinol-cytochrome c reductase iron-sulfur subunit [Leifsonia soli]|uniref:Cytochrome bc1 complex Rieske iron-sulfur subunit n=1 Tax=Leifsonia soli TaxID=582665 RepID=A0A852SW68_9MICO|nr:Rieske (2Fe-2S) protein [Leifsonia soli]NYD73289.1 Rieske Fe-S protein [Leifsonia soli]